MNNHFVIPQSPVTKDIVRSFWEVNRQNEHTLHETIIPKGFIEIIFNFETTPLHVNINHHTQTVPRCFIQGFHTCPIKLNLADTHIFFGVVLNPTSIKHIFNFYTSEFTNCVIDLSLIDASFHSLWHRLGEQNSFNNRVNVFSEWLKQRLPHLTEWEKAFDTFLRTHTNTNLSVNDLANYFCYSTKQLSRKLYELTGLNTERTLLYKKYLHTLNLIHSTNLSLTEVAHHCYFYDQSHFVKTFKSLSQITAKEYRKRKSILEGHIIEIVP